MLGKCSGLLSFSPVWQQPFSIALENRPALALEPDDGGWLTPILVPGIGHVMPVGQSQHSVALLSHQLRGGHVTKDIQLGFCHWKEVLSFH